MKKKFFAAFIGNFLEHYDQALYGLLVPFLAVHFFPNVDLIHSLIWMYSLYPLGVITRLLGAWLFGSLGDKKGRHVSLSITLFGMAFVTTLMGLLPTYQSIGMLAPFLLLTLRLMQNFFSSSETIGGAIFLLEEDVHIEKNLLSSIYDMTSIAGVFLASLLVTVLVHFNVIDIYWRFLFIGASLTAFIGVHIRKYKVSTASPIKITTKTSIISFFMLIMVCGLSHIIYSIIFTIMNGFLPLVSDITYAQALGMNTFFLIFDFLLLPIFGWLSFKVTKESLMRYSMQGTCLLSLPLFYFLKDSSLVVASIIRFIWVILGVSLSASFYFWASEIIKKETRFRLIAIGYTLGSQLIGKSSAVIGFWLFKKTGWIVAPGLYPFLVACVTLGLFSYHQPFYLTQKGNILSLKKER